MYIVRQDNSSVVNSEHVTLYYIEDRESAGVHFFTQEESHRIMFSCNGTLQGVLGYYNDFEIAKLVLRQLLFALQDDKDIFYMPQP